MARHLGGFAILAVLAGLALSNSTQAQSGSRPKSLSARLEQFRDDLTGQSGHAIEPSDSPAPKRTAAETSRSAAATGPAAAKQEPTLARQPVKVAESDNVVQRDGRSTSARTSTGQSIVKREPTLARAAEEPEVEPADDDDHDDTASRRNPQPNLVKPVPTIAAPAVRTPSASGSQQPARPRTGEPTLASPDRQRSDSPLPTLATRPAGSGRPLASRGRNERSNGSRSSAKSLKRNAPPRRS